MLFRIKSERVLHTKNSSDHIDIGLVSFDTALPQLKEWNYHVNR
jgi:hypothetical protein